MYKWFLVAIIILSICLLSVGEYHFKDTLRTQYGFAYEVGYEIGYDMGCIQGYRDALNR